MLLALYAGVILLEERLPRADVQHIIIVLAKTRCQKKRNVCPKYNQTMTCPEVGILAFTGQKMVTVS
jgi:hypothetical protein